jgi:putative transposase
MPSQSILIRKIKYNKSPKYRFLHSLKAHEQLPSKLNHDARLVLKDNGDIYLCYPVHAAVNDDNQVIDQFTVRNQVISLDPGVRTFMTGFEASGMVYEWGKQDIQRIIRLCKHMDNLNSRCYTKSLSHSKRYRLKKVLKRCRLKIRRTVDDMHNKMIKWLCTTFKVILLPKFNVSYMVNKKTRNISSKTARSMLTWSHYRFRSKLLLKAKQYKDCNVVICDEQFTSKTCSKCGELNQKLKGQKIFHCDNCHVILDRDVNGAINILFRYLTLSQASLSVLVQSKGV